MLRISGSFSAENCVKAVETKLQEFEIITEKHIVACVTDGVSMMVKFGKIMSYLVENTVEVEDKSHEEEDNGESEELVENLDKALDLEFESGVGTDKECILQKYVKEEFGCEKMVCLDTKTRWDSLLAMLERFLEIKSAISKALIDVKEEQKMVNVEFETVTTIVKVLKPVKIGLEKLCSRNATLLTAKEVFSFVI
ncbi:uncharacterized protein TNCV_2830341 [Trichonephila clavipes]|nr:uncharacterized protein TNCV_2830341 [Trichonephila clavipes]